MQVALKTKSPSVRTASKAEAALRVLSVAGRTRREVRVHVNGDELAVDVPAEAFDVLLTVLAEMANGNAVTVMPVHAELTTQEAAEVLNVSRPYLVKLLDDGRIPHRLVGTHRRVLVADLMAFKMADDAARSAAADELVAAAEELGLGY